MRKNINYITIVLLLLILNSCACIPWDGQKPQGLISQHKADSLETNYKNNQYRYINDAVNNGAEVIVLGEKTNLKRERNAGNSTIYQDVRTYTWSEEEITRYIGMVRQHARDEGYSNIGIRIYSGSYIEDNKPITTLFMVGTYEDENGEQQNMPDIDCFNMGSSRRKPPEYNPDN